jgi:hypothetical protein
MNNFKLEFINPGYGFRNYKIGEITVYTVRLKFNYNYYNHSLFVGIDDSEKISIRKIGDKIYVSYDTTDWNEIKKIRSLIWDVCRRIAQNNLDHKYSQLKLEL